MLHRDCRVRTESGGGARGLLRCHRGGQRTRRATPREVDDGAVDRHERDVERAGGLGDAPPPAVEQGVAAVNDSPAAGFDGPGDLRVARAVGRRERGHRERTEPDGLPRADRTARQTGCRKLGVRLPERQVRRIVDRLRRRQHHGPAVGKGVRERSGVGVVAVQVREQARDGPTRRRARDLGQDASRRRLADGRIQRSRVAERIDHERRVLSLA